MATKKHINEYLNIPENECILVHSVRYQPDCKDIWNSVVDRGRLAL